MASYTVVTATAANVAGPNNLNSTKVRVVANNTCVYAIDGVASLTSNVGAALPAWKSTEVNMGGIGRKLSVLPTNGASTLITVTEIGTVYQSAMNQNRISLDFTLQSNAVATGSSTLGLKTGMFVYGNGIATGTTLSSFAVDTSITLSANATVSGLRSLTFTTVPFTTA